MSLQTTNDQVTNNPSWAETLGTFLKIGLLSFGGPAGQIALMHKILVDEKKWIDEQRFLTGLNFCMLLPGPEAMQLATYVGWRLHGVRGGLAAGLLFVLPGAAVMLVLALGYAAFGQVPLSTALFTGVKAAVLAIVVEALLRIARRALKGRVDWVVAGIAFVAIFLAGVPFPVIVLAAGLFGFWRAGSIIGTAPGQAVVATVPAGQTLRTVLLWLAIWITPLAMIGLTFGRDHILSKMAWFFSKLAVVTFGGAYAVLAYMGQDVVQTYHWLEPGEMLDALGLAETTPGPLILVTQFVGTLAAWRQGGGYPVLMGVLGACVALWATFAPCFLWIFAGAPYIERLQSQPRLKGALAAITAAVVGVILNLTVWFGLHTLFARVDDVVAEPLHLHSPELASLNLTASGLSALAFVLLFGLHRGVITTLAICAAAAVALHLVAV